MSCAVQRAQDRWLGKYTCPQLRHLEPMSWGWSAGQVNSPASIGTCSVVAVVTYPMVGRPSSSRPTAQGAAQKAGVWSGGPPSVSRAGALTSVAGPSAAAPGPVVR